MKTLKVIAPLSQVPDSQRNGLACELGISWFRSFSRLQEDTAMR